ncbi:MAG: putative ABC transporter permease [Erysipelotrichaceae bacterium]|nr:putative ABC transporter permease [Erysipelotrichaceae bacterium]
MIAKYMIYFTVMAVIGYIYECAAMTFWLGRWDNRGSLYGPAIPIYGIGALLGTILFLDYFPDHSPLQVFLTGMIGSAFLEYPVHYLIERYLHTSYWDYSRSPLNLHGRICLPAAVGFGIAALVIVYVFNPVLLPMIELLPERLVNTAALLFAVILILDIFFSYKGLHSANPRLDAVEQRIDETMTAFAGRYLTEHEGLDNVFFGAVDRIRNVFSRHA